MEAARAGGGRRGGRLVGEDGRGVPAAALPHHGPVGRRPARVPAHLSALQEPPGEGFSRNVDSLPQVCCRSGSLVPGQGCFFFSYCSGLVNQF